jgi:hypothetical protein
MRRLLLLSTPLSCLAGASPLPAATHVVPDGFATVGAALAVSTAGDTVLVRAGTYPERVTLVDGVTLRGESLDDRPVLDGSLGGPVVSASACGPTTRVEGLVLRHGDGGTFGGGAWLSNADVVFESCRFEDNVAGTGAGLGASNADFTAVSCEFAGNVAAQTGGALAVTGVASPTISGCTMSGNSAFAGGAVAVLNGSTPLVTGCLLDANTASEGSAVWWDFFTAGTLASTTIVRSASTDVGAGALHASPFSSPTISACVVALSSSGAATSSGAGATPVWGCNDAFGNPGGDVFAGGTDLGTNLALDPQFCDVAGEDWTIHDTSPCVPGGGCPLRGAFDVACSIVGVEEPLAAVPWGRVKSLFR